MEKVPPPEGLSPEPVAAGCAAIASPWRRPHDPAIALSVAYVALATPFRLRTRANRQAAPRAHPESLAPFRAMIVKEARAGKQLPNACRC